MRQEPLDFGRPDRVSRTFSQVLRALGDAVDVIGLIQAAGACDCAKSDLIAALHAREHRHMRVEWMLAIIDVSPPDNRAAIISALIAWQGLTVKASKHLTPEERLARLEQRIAIRFGQAGAELVEENRR